MKYTTALLFIVSFLSFPQLIAAQTHHFTGDWTRKNTTYRFSFDLYLNHKDGHTVDGFFVWRIDQPDEGDTMSMAYYKDKVGNTAREYVKGTYDPKEKKYHLKGYKKDDPHKIIGIDTYIIEVDENGDIGGRTKTSGTWHGKINGREIPDDV